MPLCRNSNSAAAIVLLVVSLWTTQAVAQTSEAVSAKPVSPATSANAAPPPYRSALEGYRAYTDEKIVDWKDANATVARIGGWREYAKEASREQDPKGSAMLDAGAPPAKP